MRNEINLPPGRVWRPLMDAEVMLFRAPSRTTDRALFAGSDEQNVVRCVFRLVNVTSCVNPTRE